MTAVGCCGRRREDGYIDGAAVRNAFDGRPTRLSPTERRIVIWRMTNERRWGPQKIADNLGVHKSLVTSVLAEIRRTLEGRR